MKWPIPFLLLVAACQIPVTEGDRQLSDQNAKGAEILAQRMEAVAEKKKILAFKDTQQGKAEAQVEVDKSIDEALAACEEIAPVIKANAAQQLKNWGPPEFPKEFSLKASAEARKRSEEEHTLPPWAYGLIGAGGILTILWSASKLKPNLLMTISGFLPPPFNFISQVAIGLLKPTVEAIMRAREAAQANGGQIKVEGDGGLLKLLEDHQIKAGVQPIMEKLATGIELEKLGKKL